jgi:hypothetical protein
MGTDNPAYRVSPSGGGFAAASPAQRLSFRFDRSGVSLSSGATHVGLTLRAVGYGTSLTTVARVPPSAHANQVVYSHPNLSEWYANGPLGLEQGFTIPTAPGGHAPGPLTLSVALSGNAHASLASGGQTIVTFRGGDGPSLRYGELSATDARDRRLHSWLQLHNGRLLLRVDTRGARYPLRIDPFIQQGEILKGGEELGKAGFGASVAISADGNTALIGGPSDNENRGAAWMFSRSGGVWTQQGPKLVGGEEVGSGRFGSGVALSSDGNTALIGGGTDNNGVGAVWVFTRSGPSWAQQGPKLVAGEETGSAQVGAVALSADGNTALIGGPYDSGGTGAAWVFTRSGTTWAQQGTKLVGSGTTGQFILFGATVALSSDGNTALIGGPDANLAAAWVFTRSGSSWTQQASLTGSGERVPNPCGYEFAASVALSSDGNTALIGGRAPLTEECLGLGSAWVFTRSGTTWTEQVRIKPSDENGYAEFGASVGLSADGNTALIGGPDDLSHGGGVWVFIRSGSTWTQQGPKITAVGKGFGYSVALSAAADTALIGVPANKSSGGAFVFATNQPPAAATGSASSIGQTSATLNATVDPEGTSVSDCHVEYGPYPSYGSSLPCEPPPGSGTSAVPVHVRAEGLAANTTYQFRVVATNPIGPSYGNNSVFTTRAPNPPEYGRCIKVLAGTGLYETGTCTTLGGELKFEWYPGVAKNHFTTKIQELTIVTLATVNEATVTCQGETGLGEYTGNTTVGGVVLTLTGCEYLGEKCSTSGAGVGEVTTRPLEGILGITKLGETSVKNKIGLDLFPVGKTGDVMEFSCGATAVSVRGSVIGVAAKAMTTLTYAASSRDKQIPESFVGEPTDILEASFNEAPFEQTGLKLKTVVTNEEKVEVNPVF